MNLRVDHVFVLTEVGAPAADKLVSLGLQESFGRVHKGQGTANRRFEFSNGFLELLWVHNTQEAMTGPGALLRLAERATHLNDNSASPFASPFGIVLGPIDINSDLPFSGRSYQPEFFAPPMAFHVGKNSDLLHEPLCVCMPPSLPAPAPVPTEYANPDWQLTALEIDMPTEKPSEALKHFAAIDGIHLHFGKPHKMTMKFNNSATGSIENFFPELPLIIEW